jgi:hypothetical protein
VIAAQMDDLHHRMIHKVVKGLHVVGCLDRQRVPLPPGLDDFRFASTTRLPARTRGSELVGWQALQATNLRDEIGK